MLRCTLHINRERMCCFFFFIADVRCEANEAHRQGSYAERYSVCQLENIARNLWGQRVDFTIRLTQRTLSTFTLFMYMCMNREYSHACLAAICDEYNNNEWWYALVGRCWAHIDQSMTASHDSTEFSDQMIDCSWLADLSISFFADSVFWSHAISTSSWWILFCSHLIVWRSSR